MRLMALVLTGALAGCAVQTGPLQASGQGSSGAARPVFATQLAGPGTELAPMPTAVVLLRPGDLNRNRAFCEAFRQLPTAETALSRTVVAPNVVFTRWLLRLPDLPAAAATDCDVLVGSYDYQRAAQVMAGVRLSEGRFDGPGPYLLMIVPGVQGEHAVGLDGSSYSEAAFPAFIASWSQAVTGVQRAVDAEPRQPGLVRSVFDLVYAVFRTAAALPRTLLRGVVETL